MKSLQDLANLISVRNFLVLSIDNLHMKLSREDIKGIQTRIQYFDKTIIEHTLKLDLLKMGEEPKMRTFSFESTDDIKEVVNKVINSNATEEDVNRIKKHVTSIVRRDGAELTNTLVSNSSTDPKEDESKED